MEIENRIIKKLDEHDEKFSRLIETQERLNQNQERLGQNQERLSQAQDKFSQTQDKLVQNQVKFEHIQDKLIQKVMTIDEKIDTLATKDEVRLFEDRVMTSFDHQTKMLEKLDHERLATMLRIERIEGDVSDFKTR